MIVVNTVKSGNLGEDAAVCYLKRRRYKILDRNFRSRYGEIDIICEKSGTLVFVEVKKRANAVFGGGAAAVNKAKQEKIIKTAQIYLAGMDAEREMRFDVIEITDGEINHIENAFCQTF